MIIVSPSAFLCASLFSIARCDGVSTHKTSDTKYMGFFLLPPKQFSDSLNTTECLRTQLSSDTNRTELAQVPLVKGSVPRDWASKSQVSIYNSDQQSIRYKTREFPQLPLQVQ